jgi:uncharacterized membrane protein YcaP (DUF421 family)
MPRDTMPVVVDGQIFRDMLAYANVTKKWLRDEFKRKYKAELADVFYCEIDDQKTLYVNLTRDSTRSANL